MLKKVDINCDLGEGKTLVDCENDALLMPFITRCNVACAGHAGNSLTMQKTLENAKRFGILSGAHPGYADPDNFGRASLNISLENLVNSVLDQVYQLEEIAASIQHSLSHIKLHGALYNDAEKSPAIAQAICQALSKEYGHLTVIGLAKGEMQIAAAANALSFLREGFMDRAYLPSGHLAPRTLVDSVHHDTQTCINQVIAMLTKQVMPVLQTEQTIGNAPKPLYLEVDTYCLHGDSAIAQTLAQELELSLAKYGYAIA